MTKFVKMAICKNAALRLDHKQIIIVVYKSYFIMSISVGGEKNFQETPVFSQKSLVHAIPGHDISAFQTLTCVQSITPIAIRNLY